MDQDLKAMLESILLNQETFRNEANAKLDSITSQLDRMEAESNQDVIALLEVINGKLELTATKEDINFLAGKLGQHDLEIDRLKRVK
ncbi:hypothetical protein D3C73_866310 [compost metagenome]